MSQHCQHCGATAPMDRTMCPDCRRRMQPTTTSMLNQTGPDTTGFGTTVALTSAPETPAALQAQVPTQVPVQMPVPARAAAADNRFGFAFGLAVAIALAGVAVWAILAEMAHIRLALVSFGVAAAIAATMRTFAPTDRRAPAAIVGLTAVSAVAGLLASQYALLADAAGLGYFDVVRRVPMSKIPDLMTTGTTGITWFVMAASIWAGWSFARKMRAAA